MSIPVMFSNTPSCAQSISQTPVPPHGGNLIPLHLLKRRIGLGPAHQDPVLTTDPELSSDPLHLSLAQLAVQPRRIIAIDRVPQHATRSHPRHAPTALNPRPRIPCRVPRSSMR